MNIVVTFNIVLIRMILVIKWTNNLMVKGLDSRDLLGLEKKKLIQNVEVYLVLCIFYLYYLRVWYFYTNQFKFVSHPFSH